MTGAQKFFLMKTKITTKISYGFFFLQMKMQLKYKLLLSLEIQDLYTSSLDNFSAV